jgi:uncharacterized membrane protein
MKTKHISIIIILVSIFFIVFSVITHLHIDAMYLNQMKEFTGSTCILEDGTCIHKNPLEWLFLSSYVVGFLCLSFGIFLYFDKSYVKLEEDLQKISENLRKVKELDDEERTFEFFLKSFSEDEKKILRCIKKQEGIWQSTLRIKLNYSKAKLSLLLQDLEKKGLISREKKGKTFKLFLTYNFEDKRLK